MQKHAHAAARKRGRPKKISAAAPPAKAKSSDTAENGEQKKTSTRPNSPPPPAPRPNPDQELLSQLLQQNPLSPQAAAETPSMTGISDAPAAPSEQDIALWGDLWYGISSTIGLIPAVGFLTISPAAGHRCAAALLRCWPSLSRFEKIEILKILIFASQIGSVYAESYQAWIARKIEAAKKAKEEAELKRAGQAA